MLHGDATKDPNTFASTSMNNAEIVDTLNVKQLKHYLRCYLLLVSGNKVILQQRLRDYFLSGKKSPARPGSKPVCEATAQTQEG